jgi:hypothetical protein
MKPKKFIPVAVNPQPCPTEEAKKHLRAFAESFIDGNYCERWIHLLIEKSEKAEKALHKFEHHLNESRCKEIGRGAHTFPSSLAEVYGVKLGVYFDGSEAPCKVSVAEAATLAVERFADAIFSLEAGKRALFFHHDSGTWVCEDGSR